MTVDRQALLRDYKERAVSMGVYRVLNQVSINTLVAASAQVFSLRRART